MSYLASQGLTLKDLSKQYKGRKFGELILHHLKQQSVEDIDNSISELENNIHPQLKETTDKFLETIVHGFAKTKRFWKEDCGEALIMYTNSTKAEAKKFGIEVSDDYAFDTFNLIVLTLAKEAAMDKQLEKFIRKSVKFFGLL